MPAPLPTPLPSSAPHLCEHLEPLRLHVLALGGQQQHILQTWSNARHFAFFACILNRPALRAAVPLPAFVVDHDHRGTHDGNESGMVCERCQDGLVGYHPQAAPQDAPVIG